MSRPVGPDPVNMHCPNCGHSIRTTIERKATTKTHAIAVFLCLFLCWPCICIPYCTGSCQNTNHSCPKCKAFLGTYQS